MLGHRLSILMPQPTVKQVAASTHGQSVPRAPEEPRQAAHSGPWCTLDTKLPVAGTEIKDPEEKGQMLGLRNTRGLLRALCLDKNGMRRTQRRRPSYQSRDRACDSLGEGGILHRLKICSGRTGGRGGCLCGWDNVALGLSDAWCPGQSMRSHRRQSGAK